MPNEVEILGQKAKIANIDVHPKKNWLSIFGDDDRFLVSILFDAPIDNIALMQVLIPVRQYELPELLYAVKQKAEKSILAARKNDAERKVFIEDQRQYKLELETMAAQLRDLLGLP